MNESLSLVVRAGMALPSALLICTRCKTAKALDEFSPDSRCRSGRTSGCKACLAAAMRARFVPAPRATLFERFSQFIDTFPDPTTCWEWQGSLSWNGYGCLWPGLKAHRVAYELFVGPIPRGLTLDHLCFTTSCVNPRHLEPVTLSENTQRARVRQEFLKRIAA